MDKNSVSDIEDSNGKKQVREVQEKASAELTKIKRAGTQIRSEVETYVKEQPLAAVGIALGTGFVLGGIFGARLGRFALVAAVTYVAQDLVEGALGEGGVRGLLLDEVSKLGTAKRKASS